MAIDPAFNPARTAVLCMDMQTAIVGIYTAGQGDGQDTFVARAAEVLQRCRERGVAVIHIQVDFGRGCRRSTRATICLERF